jgi:hypothetical protein
MRNIRLLTLVAGTLLAAALQAAVPWAQTLTQRALDSGFLTRLPPTVSTAFGLAKAQDGTEVRQLLTKHGHLVRTFNVCVANHADVVALDLNAQSGASVAYLMSADGQLRKAVSYRTGGEVKTLGNADAEAGFAQVKHYWSGQAHKSGAAPSHGVVN